MRIIVYFAVLIIFSCNQLSAASLNVDESQLLFPKNSSELCIHQTLVLSETEDMLFTKNGIKVKGRVDTGAESSSLHAEDMMVFEENGQQYVHFYTMDDEGSRFEMKEKIQDVTSVTNTSGIAEKRYVIRTSIVLKGKEIMGNINLKDRSNMSFKFLIGRNLIKDQGFLVNVN
jgi:hypothetical protein